MYRCMKTKPEIGGVCGYIEIIEENRVQPEQLDELREVNVLSRLFLRVFDIRRGL
jgi:hypothetical protein